MKTKYLFLAFLAAMFLQLHSVHADENYTGDATIEAGETVVGNITITDGVLTVYGTVEGDIVHMGSGSVRVYGGQVFGNISQVDEGGDVILSQANVEGSITANGKLGAGSLAVFSSFVDGNLLEEGAGGILVNKSTVEGTIRDKYEGSASVYNYSTVYGNVIESGDGAAYISQSEILPMGRRAGSVIERGDGYAYIVASTISGRLIEGGEGELEIIADSLLKGNVSESGTGHVRIENSRFEKDLWTTDQTVISLNSEIAGNLFNENGQLSVFGLVEGDILHRGTGGVSVERVPSAKPADIGGLVKGSIYQIDAGGFVFLFGATVEGSIDSNGVEGLFSTAMERSFVQGDVIERGAGGVQLFASVVSGSIKEFNDGDISVNLSSVKGNVIEFGNGSVEVFGSSSVSGPEECDGNIFEFGPGDLRVANSTIEGSLLETRDGNINVEPFAFINENVIENGDGEITGDTENQVLGDVVDNVRFRDLYQYFNKSLWKYLN